MKILFCGDISFSAIQRFEFSSSVKELFSSHDLVVGNLESVVTESVSARPLHPIHLKTSRLHINHLRYFDVLNLANNHVLDYGEEGISDTIEVLRECGIEYFGAGLNKGEANSPLVVSRNGQSIGFVAATRFANATRRRAGAANDNLRRILRSVRTLKLQGCFVVIMPHWGYEHVPLPAPRQRLLARRMIGVGGDLVVGTHPHVHQGFEEMARRTVFYSLGNFVFSSQYFKSRYDWKLKRSIMVAVEVASDMTYSFRLIPYETTDNGVRLLYGREGDSVIADMMRIRAILAGQYSKYLKLYLSQTAFSVEFGKAAVRKQLRAERQGASCFDRMRKMVEIYRKANWQDAMNHFYPIFLRALWRVDVKGMEVVSEKKQELPSKCGRGGR
jgi:hypothetical protein